MNCGMLATGKHGYFDYLRGAPRPRDGEPDPYGGGGCLQEKQAFGKKFCQGGRRVYTLFIDFAIFWWYAEK